MAEKDSKEYQAKKNSYSAISNLEISTDRDFTPSISPVQFASTLENKASESDEESLDVKEPPTLQLSTGLTENTETSESIAISQLKTDSSVSNFQTKQTTNTVERSTPPAFAPPVQAKMKSPVSAPNPVQFSKEGEGDLESSIEPEVTQMFQGNVPIPPDDSGTPTPPSDNGGGTPTPPNNNNNTPPPQSPPTPNSGGSGTPTPPANNGNTDTPTPDTNTPNPDATGTPTPGGSDTNNPNPNPNPTPGPVDNNNNNTPAPTGTPSPGNEPDNQTPQVQRVPTPENMNPRDPSSARSGVDWDQFWADNGLNLIRSGCEIGRLVPIYGLIPGMAADVIETISDFQTAEPANDNFINLLIGLRMPVVLFNNVIGHLEYVTELVQDGATLSVIGIEIDAVTVPLNEGLDGIQNFLLGAQTLIDTLVLTQSIYGMRNSAIGTDEWNAYKDTYNGYGANLIMDGFEILGNVIDMGTGSFANAGVITHVGKVLKNLYKNKKIFFDVSSALLKAWVGVWGGNIVGEARDSIHGTENGLPPTPDSPDPNQDPLPNQPAQRKVAQFENDPIRMAAGQIIIGELNRMQTAYNLGTGILEEGAAFMGEQFEHMDNMFEHLTGEDFYTFLRNGITDALTLLHQKVGSITQMKLFASSSEEKAQALSGYLDEVEAKINAFQLPNVNLQVNTEIGDNPLANLIESGISELSGAASSGANALLGQIQNLIDLAKNQGLEAVSAMREQVDEVVEWLEILIEIIEEQIQFFQDRIQELIQMLNECGTAKELANRMLGALTDVLGLEGELSVEGLLAGWEGLQDQINGGFEWAENMVREASSD